MTICQVQQEKVLSKTPMNAENYPEATDGLNKEVIAYGGANPTLGEGSGFAPLELL